MSRIGLVIEGNDSFFLPIEAALRQKHEVDRFQARFIYAPAVGGRVNSALLKVQLAQFLRTHDVVFFEWAGPLLALASKMNGASPIVARLHSVELTTGARDVNWENVDSAILVSQHMRRRLLDTISEPPRSVSVIHNGVNLEHFQPTERTFNYRIGMACRVIPLKRVYEAVLALYDLRRKGYPFTLHIAGERGRDAEPRFPLALDHLISKLNLEHAISFYGHVDDMPGWFRHVDICLSNSYWEGLSVSLLEGMASGCYCLAHCWEGAEEALPEENIFVTDSDLQAKLIAYSALPEEERIGRCATMRRMAQDKFDERRMVRDIVGITERAGNA